MDLLVEQISLACCCQAQRIQAISPPAPLPNQVSIESVVEVLLNSYKFHPNRTQGRKARVYAKLAGVSARRIAHLLQSRDISIIELLEDGLISSLEKCSEFSLKAGTPSREHKVSGIIHTRTYIYIYRERERERERERIT